MWLGSDLIGVVLPSETPYVKPDKYKRGVMDDWIEA